MPVFPMLQKARDYYNSSKSSDDPALESAYFLVSEHLEHYPDDVTALDLASLIRLKQKLPDEAISLLLTLNDLCPNNSGYIENLALAHKQTGDLENAHKSILKSIDLEPDNHTAYNALGNILSDMGELESAIKAYEKSIALNDVFFPAYSNLSMTLLSLGRNAKSLEYIRKAIELNPDNIDILNSYSIVLKNIGDYDKALEALNKVIANNPRYAAAYNNLGLIYATEKEDFRKAEQCFKTAIEVDPLVAEYHNNLGSLLYNINRSDEAIIVLKKALEIRPDYPDALGNLGNAFLLKGDLENAEKYNLQTLKIDAENAYAYYNLGVIERDRKNYSKSAEYTEKAIALAEEQSTKTPPLAPDIFYNSMGIIYTDMGETDKGIAAYKKALNTTHNPEIYSNYLLALHYNDSTSNAELFSEHKNWATKFAKTQKLTPTTTPSKQAENKKLKVGYVSGDFKAHSVSFFCREMIKNHNRDKFKIYCYSYVRKPDKITAEIKENSDTWRDIATLSNLEIANQIKQDEIDILVDLSGHTADNKLPAFTLKPAPIQVEYLGYPNTSGLAEMDYRIVDNYTDPASDETTDAQATENLFRMPNSFICYEPLEGSVPDVAEAPCLSDNGFTFGSFNNISKICDSVIKTWATILSRLPDSKLILKSKQTSDERVKNRLLEGFINNGAKEEQIIFISHAPTLYKHLEIYSRIDIALDTFPYNGTTTTCEAMWMGVPTLCLNGNRHSGRVGTSIIKNVGIDEHFLTYTIDEYIEQAVYLSKNTDIIASIRPNLRDKMAKSPLCDQNKFIIELEDAYQEMWRKYISN
jgi:predicted O-linked N-acetylglucosamine transferase (SPINDLY family)